MEDAREYEDKLRRDFINNEYHAPVKISYDEWVDRHVYELENSDLDLAAKTIVGHREALRALGEI